jgi:hypothetical protein
MFLPMRHASWLMFLSALLLLAGCTSPRSPQVSRDQAIKWHEQMELRVVRHWDALRHSRDPHLSHLVEVEYVSGTSKTLKVGERFVLPYDRWAMGEDPPPPGESLMLMPSQWVQGKKR